jgi:DNA-binding NtrC family response regulator
MDVIKTLRQVEEEHIIEVLKVFNGHRTKTSEALGISRKCLLNRVKSMHSRGMDVQIFEATQMKKVLNY